MRIGDSLVTITANFSMLTRTGLTKLAVSLALAAMGLVFMPPASAGQTVAAAPGAKAKTASKTPARANKSTVRKKAYSASSARARRAQLARARATASKGIAEATG